MKYKNLDNEDERVSLSEALCTGKNYVPEQLPLIKKSSIRSCSSFQEMAFEVLHPFFEDDVLETHLVDICCNVFNTEFSLTPKGSSFVFDMTSASLICLRFYAACLNELFKKDGNKMTMAVADDDMFCTEILSSFKGFEYVDVLQVSSEEKKKLLLNKEKKSFFAMNPLNIAMVLPLTACYYYCSMAVDKVGFVIPSDTYTNGVAALWTFGMGAKIEKIIVVEDENAFSKKYMENDNSDEKDYPLNLKRLISFFPEKKAVSDILSFVSSDKPLDKREEDVRVPFYKNDGQYVIVKVK